MKKGRRWPALHLEMLEDRTTPALQLIYGGTGTALSLGEQVAASDNVTVSEPIAGTLRINLNGANFDAGSTVAAPGLTYENPGSPATSTFADINISVANAISSFSVGLGANIDTMSLGFTNAANALGTIQINGGSVDDSVTLNALSAPGTSLLVSFDNIAVNGSMGLGSGNVFLAPFSAGRVISLGAENAGQLGLTDGELDRIQANTLTIGAVANTGGIHLAGQIIQNAGSYQTLVLVTNGAIVDQTVTEQPDITAGNLAVRAGTGLGSANNLDLAVTNLAFNNVTSGAVNITNTGLLTLTSVAGIAISNNFGGTTDLTSMSPIIVAANIVSVGTITIVSTEDSDPMMFDDFIQVNSGVTISSTGGDVNLFAGDDLILQAGSLVSASGSLVLAAGSGDLEGRGNISLAGNIAATTSISISAIGDVVLVNLINLPGGDVSISSSGGAVLDGNMAANNITSNTLTLIANTGMGTGLGGSIDTQVNNLFAINNIGDIFIDNTGSLNVDGVLTFGDVILQAFGGSIRSTFVDGFADILANTLTINATVAGTIGNGTPLEIAVTTLNSTTAGGTVNVLDTFGGLAIGTVNANGGNVTLQVSGGNLTSAGVDGLADVIGNVVTLLTIGSGTIGNGGPLEINATSLAATTPNALINIFDTAGGLTLISVNAGTDLVLLRVNGLLNGTPGGVADVIASALRVEATGGINLDTQVSNLAFNNTAGVVVISNRGPLTINSVAGLLTSSNTGTTTDLTATSPLVFAVNTTSAGTLTGTASETNDFPLCVDDVSVLGGVTVSSTGGDVVLRAGDDVNLLAGSAVAAPAGSVVLTAGFADLDACGDLLLFGTITAGVNIQLQGIGDVCIGALSAPGLISVTSLAGSIIDCNDPPAGTLNITANQLLLLAATGIGAAGAIGTIETNVNFLEAVTTTGGIFISDTGSFDVGGVDATVQGVRNTGASGAITLAAVGTIRVINAGEIIRAPDLVTVAAGQDVVTGGNNALPPFPLNAFEAAISSSNNAISLTAGQDILLGFPTGRGDVRAANNLTLLAGRDIIVDAGTSVDAGAGLVSGNLAATAGRDVRIRQTISPNSRLGTFGGTITITTGAGGEFELNTGNGAPGLFGVRTDLVSLNLAGGPGGNITINADDVEIVDPNDQIHAGLARVTIQPITAGRPIDLGTNGSGSNLGLTSFEFNRIIAGVVTVGSATTGPITVTNAVTIGSFGVLHLITPSTISANAVGTLAIANLALQGNAGVNLPNANTVGTLAGTTAGTPFVFTNSALLTIGTVDGISGITTGSEDVTLTSPDLAVNSAITTGIGDVNLIPTPDGAIVGVGTNVGTMGVTYGISNAELSLINSTGLITIGISTNTGGILVSGSETVGPASLAGKNLDLITGGNISVLGSLTGPATLGLIAGEDITLTAAGTLGATQIDLLFGLNGNGATATITGTLQSPNAATSLSGPGDDTLLLNFTSPTALPAAGLFANDLGGNDTLDGPNFNQLFTLTGANTGTLAGVAGSYQGTVNYFGYENLLGGTADDRFLFMPGSSLAGNIDGVAGGVNKLDYTLFGSAVTINLQTSTATAIGGTFANINSFCGFVAPGVCSDLIGADIINDWQITALDAGTINAIPFMGFGNLFGGTNTDTFTFGLVGQLTCNIDGGAGVNTIIGNDVAHTYSITGVNNGAIDTLFLGSIAPALPAPSPCPTNIVTPAAPPLRFSNIQNLVAGAGDDRFFFVTPGALGGTIQGGAGINTIYGDNGGRTYTINGGGLGTISVLLPAGFTGVQNLIGGTGADVFVVNSIGAVNMTLAGVQGTDTFTINATGTADLLACGGDDEDTFTVAGTGAGTTTLNGNLGTDSFTINNTGAGPVIATGDEDNDILVVNALTGPVTLSGNLGNDVFTVNGTGAGLLTAGGNDGNDDFQVNAIGIGGALLNGDEGNDRFAIRAIAGATTVNGGADNDLINVGSAATVAALNSGNLDGIAVTLNLNTGSGVDVINIGDQTAGAANTAVEVTNSSITGFAPGTINYTAGTAAADSLALNLIASNLGDTFNVRSTLANPANPAGNLTTIQGGTSNDRFNLGSLANVMDGLLGRLSVQGNVGVADQVCFFDQGQTIAYNYIINATTFARTGGLVSIPAITYGGMEMFKAQSGSGEDNFVINAIGATTSADIMGNDGDDQFQITATTANALVASLMTNLFGGNGRDRFFVQSTAAATPGKVNMFGETGDDQFSFIAMSTLANGCIDGGVGIDTLDYTNATKAALVNLRPTSIPLNSPLTPGQQRPGTTTPGLPAGVLGLAARTACGLFGGALNLPGAANRIAMANATDSTIENVVGSALADAVFGAGEANRFEGRLGNDYFFGGAGNDIAIGNEGDDSLFGEAGNDTIYGAGGRDAMYGGTGFDTLLIDSCNDVRPGLRTGDRVLDLGGLGPNGGVIDLVRRVPPLVGQINDPRINWSNVPLQVFQVLLQLRTVATS